MELSEDQNWKPIRDEVRRLAHIHGLAEIPERNFSVRIYVKHANAGCEFKEESDARDLFGMLIENLERSLANDAE